MPQKNKISFASDHAGFQLKELLIKKLEAHHPIIDLGTNSTEAVDYPEFAYKLADLVAGDAAIIGILICGSGIGMSIAANRNKNIRAALCYNAECATLARLHNDANILVLGARFVDQDQALEIIQAFLNTEFNGERHQLRVEQLSNPKTAGNYVPS